MFLGLFSFGVCSMHVGDRVLRRIQAKFEFVQNYNSLVRAVAVFIVLFLSGAAFAETQQEKIERLERSLTTLEKQVYRSSASKPRGGKNNPGEENAGALDARMVEIEERMRAMNGKIEEMDYSLRKFAERLDAIIGDVDRRINKLETRYSGGGMVTNYAENPAPATAPAQAVPNAAAVIPPAFPADGALPAEANTQIATDLALEQNKVAENKTAPVDEKAVYDQAFDLLRQGKYDESARELQSFLTKYPKSSYADNAYYWLGETFYLQKTYDKAAVQFMRGYQYAPKGNKAADNLLKLGMSLAELKKTKEACTTFRKLTQEFSDETLAANQRAVSEIKRLKCGA